MKILTKEEEREHYNATITGGLLGGFGGIAVGGLGVLTATRRFPAFKELGLPLQAFLVCSSGTFGAIVSADRYSRNFERNRDGASDYQDKSKTLQEQINAQRSTMERAKAWGMENRYSIIFGSWVAAVATSLAVIGRDPYLSTTQKVVQTRVWAQGLTLAVIIASAALETGDSVANRGRWETVKILDPNDPEHKKMIEKKIHHERYAGEDQWRDMVEAEEQRIKEREKYLKDKEEEDHKKDKSKRVADHDPKQASKGKVDGPKDEKLKAP